MRTLNLLIVCIACLTGAYAQEPVWKTVSSQDAAHALEQMNSHYSKITAYSVSVQHALFDTYTASKPSRVYKGYMKKQGSSYHSQLLGLETVQNAKYKVVVDTAGHRVSVSKPDPESVLTAASFTGAQLEQVLKRCMAVQKAEMGGSEHYKLSFDAASPFSALTLVLSKKDHALQKIIFFHQAEARTGTGKDAPKTRPRTEITFSDFRNAPKLSAKEFSEQPYVSGEGKKLALTPAYSRFQLINHLFQLN